MPSINVHQTCLLLYAHSNSQSLSLYLNCFLVSVLCRSCATERHSRPSVYSSKRPPPQIVTTLGKGTQSLSITIWHLHSATYSTGQQCWKELNDLKYDENNIKINGNYSWQPLTESKLECTVPHLWFCTLTIDCCSTCVCVCSSLIDIYVWISVNVYLW